MKAIALVGRVSDVQPHPDNAELNNKMDIVTLVIHQTLGGQQYARQRVNVANRPSPDQPRYKIGDYAVMFEENTILPDWLIKHLDMWDDVKNKGKLGGKLGNRLRTRSMGLTNKILSEVALCPVWWTRFSDRVHDVFVQEGVLHFTENMLDEWPKDALESTPARMITKVIAADGTVTYFRNDYLLPWSPQALGVHSDDFSPEGENVAWNLGITEIFEG